MVFEPQRDDTASFGCFTGVFKVELFYFLDRAFSNDVEELTNKMHN
jgi:hypothetical protein